MTLHYWDYTDDACRALAQKAAMAGDVEAQVSLAVYLKFKNDYLSTDWDTIRGWLLLAAAQKNHEAYYHLGDMYLMGQGCEKDWLKALSYYESCPEHNPATECYHRGYMHFHGGHGLKQDHAKAYQYFNEALPHMNDEPACYENCLYYLGLMHFYGLAVERNPLMAYTYLALVKRACHMSAPANDDPRGFPSVSFDSDGKVLSNSCWHLDKDDKWVWMLGEEECRQAMLMLNGIELQQANKMIQQHIEDYPECPFTTICFYLDS